MDNLMKGIASTGVDLTLGKLRDSKTYLFVARQAYHYVRTISILVIIIVILVTSTTYAKKYSWWLSLFISIATFICGASIAGVVTANIYPPTKTVLQIIKLLEEGEKKIYEMTGLDANINDAIEYVIASLKK